VENVFALLEASSLVSRLLNPRGSKRVGNAIKGPLRGVSGLFGGG